MKNKELLEVINSTELTPEEKAARIQAMNGMDVNASKQSSADEITKLQDRVKELEESNAKYKDYDDLVKFHDETIAKNEETQKLDYLKSMKVKETYAKMVMGQIDWSKGKYDAEKKTYTGLDDQFKASKETYKDLYEPEGKVQTFSFDGNAGGSEPPKATTNSSMNAFIRSVKN